MSHKRRHTISRLQKKYKHLAAAVAGAAILAGASIPGTAPALAHAAETAAKQPDPLSVPTGDTNLAALTAAPAGAPEKYLRSLVATATAYAPGAHDNGPWGNKTYLGTQVRPGVIAVDPRVIPLGSRVYIQYPDGSGEYAVAEDTGGAIKGNRIDIAKWTVKEANNFGMQKVKVYVISSPKPV